MTGVYASKRQNNNSGHGFGQMMAVSILLHFIFISLILVNRGRDQKAIIGSPVYTVNLVELPSREGGISVTRDKNNHSRPLTHSGISKVNNTSSVHSYDDDALIISHSLKNIKKRVLEKEAEASISSTINRLRSKIAAKKNRKEALRRLRSEILSVDNHETGKVDTGIGSALRQGVGVTNKNETDIEYIEYYRAIKDKIGNFWIYRGNAEHGDFVSIEIYIDESGQISGKQIEKEAIDPELNQSALASVEMASKDTPLPLPPADFDGRIVFRFCPSGCPE